MKNEIHWGFLAFNATFAAFVFLLIFLMVNLFSANGLMVSHIIAGLIALATVVLLITSVFRPSRD